MILYSCDLCVGVQFSRRLRLTSFCRETPCMLVVDLDMDVDFVLDVDTAIVVHDLPNAPDFDVYLGKAVHDHVEVQVHVHGDVAVNRFEKRVSRQKPTRS